MRADKILYLECLCEEVAPHPAPQTFVQNELRDYIVEAHVTKCEFLVVKRLEKFAEESKKEGADVARICCKEQKHIT